jgi:hypothetical protein
MSTKVSPFMGGLGIDATSKFEIQSNATVTVGDGTNGGNVAVGDNGVISFGAGSDLQIYHNPATGSYIEDAGAGNLILKGTSVVIDDSSGARMATFIDGGAVTLNHGSDASARLATTSGGIDVTGDVGGDTLTVSGDGTISGDVTLGTNSSNTILITGSIDLGTL